MGQRAPGVRKGAPLAAPLTHMTVDEIIGRVAFSPGHAPSRATQAALFCVILPQPSTASHASTMSVLTFLGTATTTPSTERRLPALLVTVEPIREEDGGDPYLRLAVVNRPSV